MPVSGSAVGLWPRARRALEVCSRSCQGPTVFLENPGNLHGAGGGLSRSEGENKKEELQLKGNRPLWEDHALGLTSGRLRGK